MNKFIALIVLLLFVSCSSKSQSKEETTIGLKEIYIGKVFFSGDELIKSEWIKSGKFKNIDSLSYSIYKRIDTEDYIVSIEKKLKNDDVEKFKIIDTINIKNYTASDLTIKESVLNNKVNVVLLWKNKILKTWKFNFKNSTRNQVLSNWIGNYHLTINDESEDWRENKGISISITKDSIIYEAAGYQAFQKYLLNITNIKRESINLSYNKLIEGSESDVLKRTEDFGIITFDGGKYLWSSPYMDMSFNNNKKQYVLDKR